MWGYQKKYARFSQKQLFKLACQLDKSARFVEAARLYRHLAERGHLKAQINLGIYHAQGFGTRQDHSEARRFWIMAAKWNHPIAFFNLACSFDLEGKTPLDRKRALCYYTRAAALGDAQALHNLGLMFWTGDGIACDLAIAQDLFAESAAQGCSHLIGSSVASDVNYHYHQLKQTAIAVFKYRVLVEECCRRGDRLPYGPRPVVFAVRETAWQIRRLLWFIFLRLDHLISQLPNDLFIYLLDFVTPRRFSRASALLTISRDPHMKKEFHKIHSARPQRHNSR